jgi:hypothetical protein
VVILHLSVVKTFLIIVPYIAGGPDLLKIIKLPELAGYVQQVAAGDGKAVLEELKEKYCSSREGSEDDMKAANDRKYQELHLGELADMELPAIGTLVLLSSKGVPQREGVKPSSGQVTMIEKRVPAKDSIDPKTEQQELLKLNVTFDIILGTYY